MRQPTDVVVNGVMNMDIGDDDIVLDADLDEQSGTPESDLLDEYGLLDL
ncbi:MAG: hypothetical protein U5O39_11890 [Gammaproteobacteria bacterium]|nr:hypothetical protein [Gammaproteobacteria bacterium]